MPVKKKEQQQHHHLHQACPPRRPVDASRVKACDPLHPPAPLARLQLVGQEAADVRAQAVPDAVQGGGGAGELLQEQVDHLCEAPRVLHCSRVVRPH